VVELSLGAGAPKFAEADAVAPAAHGGWTVLQRVGFRFAFLFYAIWFYSWLLEFTPGSDNLSSAYFNAFKDVFGWIAAHVFAVRVPAEGLVAPNGSGDTTFNYIQLFTSVCLTIVGTVLWSAVARAKSSPRLYEGLRISLRYCLAMTLLTYGLAKVIPTQFSPPWFNRLLQPIGTVSPMGILWTFMGASMPYTIFSGLLETIGGLLLFFRRTTTLGALVAIAVLTNIVALNFCYDVPVKLNSSLYLASAFFLLLPDLRNLLYLLVLHRRTEPRSLEFPWRTPWLRVARPVLKILVIAAAILIPCVVNLSARQTYFAAPRPPLYGLYEVEEFQRDGKPVEPLLTEKTRWRYLLVENYTGIRRMDDSSRFYAMKVDSSRHTVTLLTPEQAEVSAKDREAYTFAYETRDPQHLILRGRYKGEELVAMLRRADMSKFLLVNRGFHWINEYPVNR
jgi:hypothetical protein